MRLSGSRSPSCFSSVALSCTPIPSPRHAVFTFSVFRQGLEEFVQFRKQFLSAHLFSCPWVPFCFPRPCGFVGSLRSFKPNQAYKFRLLLSLVLAKSASSRATHSTFSSSCDNSREVYLENFLGFARLVSHFHFLGFPPFPYVLCVWEFQTVFDPAMILCCPHFVPAVTSVRHGGRPGSACWLRREWWKKWLGRVGAGPGIESLGVNFYPVELFVPL